MNTSLWERIKAFFANYGKWVALGIGLILALVFKAKLDTITTLQARLRLLTLERQLGKLEEERRKNEEAFKSKLNDYNRLKSEYADIVSRLGLRPSS